MPWAWAQLERLRYLWSHLHPHILQPRHHRGFPLHLHFSQIFQRYDRKERLTLGGRR